MNREPKWHKIRAEELGHAADLCDELVAVLIDLEDWDMPRHLRRRLRRVVRALRGRS